MPPNTGRERSNEPFQVTAHLGDPPGRSHAVVVGAGTMGADVSIVLARTGCRVTIVDPDIARSGHAAAQVKAAIAPLGARIECTASFDDVGWADVALVVENIPERLELKQAAFAELDRIVPSHTVITSNSSGLPIGSIGGALPGAARMFGLHFFMPAHLVPLVEVVMGPRSDPAIGERLCSFMRSCHSVPVLVRKDKAGFLANRLQHALAREAFALIDEGVASAEDVDAAVRFGFGFRFLAAGPVLQRDHAGLDVHCAAAATIYPTLSNTTVPSRALRDNVRAGRLGMKTGAGFFEWPEERRRAERDRYDGLPRRGLELLASELRSKEG